MTNSVDYKPRQIQSVTDSHRQGLIKVHKSPRQKSSSLFPPSLPFPSPLVSIVKVDVCINGIARVRHCVGHPAGRSRPKQLKPKPSTSLRSRPTAGLPLYWKKLNSQPWLRSVNCANGPHDAFVLSRPKLRASWTQKRGFIRPWPPVY